MYDEYVYNAVALLRYLIGRRMTINGSAALQLDVGGLFESLHGYAATDATQNVRMHFSLWDFDPADGLFHPVMEQAEPPLGPLIAVGGRLIHWPRNGGPPASDHCAFNDCSTSISSTFRCVFTARRYASAVYAVVVCLCVPVCHTPVLRQNGNHAYNATR